MQHNQTVEQFLKSIIIYRSDRTFSTYNNHLNKWTHLFFDEPAPLTHDHFAQFIDYLRSQSLSDSAINSHIRTIKAYLNYCHKYLNKPKYHVPMLREIRKLPNVWTVDQLNLMQTELDQRATKSKRFTCLRRAHYMLRYTAMRAGELFNLRWEQIGDGIRLENSDTWNTKNRQDAVLPIANPLREFLDNEPHEDEINYLNHHFKEISHLTYSMRKFQKSIGVNGPKPLHGYRASVATELLSSNHNPIHVQHLLRHERIETTQLYLNASYLPLQDLVNEIGNCNERWPERESNLRHTDFQSLQSKMDELLSIVKISNSKP